MSRRAIFATVGVILAVLLVWSLIQLVGLRSDVSVTSPSQLPTTTEVSP